MQSVQERNEEIIKIVNTTPEPVSIDFVSYKTGLAWGTIRAILLELALQSKITAEKTTKGWIFKSKERALK